MILFVVTSHRKIPLTLLYLTLLFQIKFVRPRCWLRRWTPTARTCSSPYLQLTRWTTSSAMTSFRYFSNFGYILSITYICIFTQYNIFSYIFLVSWILTVEFICFWPMLYICFNDLWSFNLPLLWKLSSTSPHLGLSPFYIVFLKAFNLDT